MPYLLDRIQAQLQKEGFAPRSIKARDWLRTKFKNISQQGSRKNLLSDRDRFGNARVDTYAIGRMFYFVYDAKHKDTLPYFDRFPLVIPIEMYKDGFLGLNLHYLHPKQRMILLDKLSSFATDDRYDLNTKLRLSYKLLASASRLYEVTPCIKRYLYGHMQTRLVEVFAEEWDIAALLPVENFSGATTSKVWADSRKKF